TQTANRSFRVAGAQEPAGQRAGVLAPLEGWRASQECGDVTVDPLHEAAPAGRKIIDELRLVEPQAVEVDQVDVSAQAGRAPAAVVQAEEIRRLTGLPLDQPLQR